MDGGEDLSVVFPLLLVLHNDGGHLGDVLLQVSAKSFRDLELVLSVFKFGIDLISGFLDLLEIFTLKGFR